MIYSFRPGLTLVFLFILCLCATTVVRADIDTAFNARIQTAAYRQKRVEHLIALPGSKALAAGLFNTYNGVPVGRVIRLNGNGTLDTTFDNQQIAPTSDVVLICALPDGKVLVYGNLTLSNGTTFSFKAIRLNADGSLDTGFSAQFGGPFRQIGTDTSGRVLISGNLQFEQGGNPVVRPLIRLNDDGSVDPTFDINPAVEVDRFTVQGDKVVYTDFDHGAQKFRVNRLNENGTSDVTFTATLELQTIYQVKTQADNKVLLITDQKLLRVNENGGIDAGFQVPPIFSGTGRGTFVHPDGRITYYHGNSPPNGVRVLRIAANGTADPTFTPYNFANDTNGAPCALLSDGGFLLGDENGATPQNRFTKLLPGGQVDTSFNAGGTGFQEISQGTIRAIKVLADSKIMVGGDFDKVNDVFRSKIARLNDDSSLDPTFQISTTGTNRFTEITDVFDITTQSDGKFLISGVFTYIVGGSTKINVVRLNTDGTIDPSFVLSLNITSAFESSGFGTNRPVQRTDAKIGVGTSRGQISDPMTTPLLLNTNGSKDASFAPTLFSSKNAVLIFDIVALPNGQILFSGEHQITDISTSIRKGFIARLNANGTVDTTFQIFEPANKRIFRFSVLPSGKVLTVLQTDAFSSVVRLNADGTVDDTFAAGIGANGRINAIAVLSTGEILVGGSFSTFDGQSRQNLALLDKDGNLAEDIGSVNGVVFCITVDNEGRVLIGGRFTSISSGGEVALIPYLTRLEVGLSQPATTPFDYDGDGKADISVFRPSSGSWYLNRSADGFLGMQFGIATDKIVPADYDGDGKTDIAVYRPAEGQWYIVNSSSGVAEYRIFGLAEDLPAPADYDGDGKADICVFRPSTGTWYLQRSSNGSFFGIQFGSDGDRPTVGDFDGDGKSDIGIWRPSNGDWYHIRSSDSTIFGERFGISTDKIVPADYDGDGKTDLAVWRPSSGTWYIKQSSTGSYVSFLFGLSTDIPAPGDFDGDGKTDRSVFREADGTWYITNSTNGSFTIFPWGQAGDRPTPAAFEN